MVSSFWRHVNKLLQEADIIIEVLDARMVAESRNVEIERKVQQRGKKLLYAINKCDLVGNMETLQRLKKQLQPSVFISSKDRLGTTILKRKILELSSGKPTVVGIVGYPNVGKSSLINALSGRGAARTSAESGFTKGLQKVRVGPKIMLIDSPGVFGSEKYGEEKNTAHRYAKIGAVDYAKVKDPEVVVLHLIEEEMEKICRFYGVEMGEPEEVLERIAQKHKKIGKGGKPNLEIASRMVLRQWQKGEMGKG